MTEGPGPAPAGGTLRLATPNRNQTDSSWRLDIKPGSFIYTVKVTSEFLRLEGSSARQRGPWGGGTAAGAEVARPHLPGPPPCLEFREKTPQPQKQAHCPRAPRTPPHTDNTICQRDGARSDSQSEAWDFSLSSCSLRRPGFPRWRQWEGFEQLCDWQEAAHGPHPRARQGRHSRCLQGLLTPGTQPERPSLR